VEDHAHAETEMTALCKRLADASETNDTDCLAGNLRSDHVRRAPAVPFTGAHLPLAFAAPTGDGEKQEHCYIGGAVRQHAGGIRHHDPSRLRSIYVDVIEADPEITQYAGARRDATEDSGRQSIRDRRQDSIVLCERRTQRLPTHGNIIHIQCCIKTV
jgi:hypothetical protein